MDFSPTALAAFFQVQRVRHRDVKDVVSPGCPRVTSVLKTRSGSCPRERATVTRQGASPSPWG